MSKEKKMEPQEEQVLDPLVEELKVKNDQLLRLAAEFDNFKKRSARERDETWANARADLFKTLLPVMDNFERACGEQPPSADTTTANSKHTADYENYRRGIDMIFAQFCEVFAGSEVKSFGEVGEAFDPNCHQAVMHMEDEKLGKNVIAAVFTKGYRVKDKVIREAMVSVAN